MSSPGTVRPAGTAVVQTDDRHHPVRHEPHRHQPGDGDSPVRKFERLWLAWAPVLRPQQHCEMSAKGSVPLAGDSGELRPGEGVPPEQTLPSVERRRSRWSSLQRGVQGLLPALRRFAARSARASASPPGGRDTGRTGPPGRHRRCPLHREAARRPATSGRFRLRWTPSRRRSRACAKVFCVICDPGRTVAAGSANVPAPSGARIKCPLAQRVLVPRRRRSRTGVPPVRWRPGPRPPLAVTRPSASSHQGGDPPLQQRIEPCEAPVGQAHADPMARMWRAFRRCEGGGNQRRENLHVRAQHDDVAGLKSFFSCRRPAGAAVAPAAPRLAAGGSMAGVDRHGVVERAQTGA